MDKLMAATSAESRACVKCHQKAGAPVVVEQWAQSRHAENGIGCYECHQADKADKDAFQHNGFTISVLVTPKDCGQCHDQEAKEFEASHHAKAAEILGSLDNVLGDVVEGPPALNMGCAQCHGSTVKILAGGKPDPATWPNEGIGRINPDGSKGSCGVCHSRHTFAASISRQPESCGYCHLGPDHPQEEIYAESKHGVTYRALIGRMNLESDSWVLGKDYNAAPTCATCHMGATRNLPSTHDVGTRLSWTLCPEVSIRQQDWQPKRGDMKKVCLNCHATSWVNNFYAQYDSVVDLYNTKFGEPAKAIMAKLQTAGKLGPTPFSKKIQWDYFEMWHHQGRRARMGTAMLGPDYVQWHGFYEVAKIFYSEFLPEAEALLPGEIAEVPPRDAQGKMTLTTTLCLAWSEHGAWAIFFISLLSRIRRATPGGVRKPWASG
jgi:hypothetical protein